MEASERPERGEADGVGNKGLDSFRELAIEYDEKAGDGGPKVEDDVEHLGRSPEKVEVERPQNVRQGSEGLEEFRPHAQEVEDLQEQARTSSARGATSVSEASAAMVPEPPIVVEPEVDQDVMPLDGTMTVGPGTESDQVRVGAYVDFRDQVPVINQEAPPPKPAEAKLEIEDFHRFPSESEPRPEVEEPRVLETVDYGKGAVLRVPKTDLEEAGFEPEPGQNSILELGLKNAEGGEVETVFARYVASDKRAEAYVGDIGGEKGSTYELVEARKYDEDRFVGDFERGKCEHLQNVGLEDIEDKVFVNVDHRSVELEDCRLATSGSHVVMRGKLDGDTDCKIEFDGRSASVRFGRDYPVEEMRMEGDDLVVRYVQSRNERHEHRIPLEHHESPERPSLNQLDKEEMKEHVEMFDRPERIEGVYQFVLDRGSSAEVHRLLTEARERGDNDYGMMKAEISERLVPNMLEIAGWERIKWHPFNDTEKEGADAPGTDWLLRTPDGKEVLVEIKWYENTRDAMRKATTQVEKDFQEHRDDPDLKLEGAYIAIVDYAEDSKDGCPIKVHVLRVHSKEALR